MPGTTIDAHQATPKGEKDHNVALTLEYQKGTSIPFSSTQPSGTNVVFSSMVFCCRGSSAIESKAMAKVVIPPNFFKSTIVSLFFRVPTAKRCS